MSSARKAGFTLLEISIVVAIIGLLAAMAIPGFSKSRALTRNARFVNDLRVAANAFDLYAQLNGDYPPDVGPGMTPTNMTEDLRKVGWAGTTPIGGQWDWDFQVMSFGGRAGVSVYRPDRTTAEMTVIDAMIDDGDLTSGEFRRRHNGYIFFVQR